LVNQYPVQTKNEYQFGLNENDFGYLTMYISTICNTERAIKKVNQELKKDI
jgi:hypothetical protein